MSDQMLALIWIALVALLHVLVLAWYVRRRRRRLRGPDAAQKPSDAPADVPPAVVPAALPAPHPAAQLARVLLRKPSATKHPILLAHGWFGFDRIGVPRLGQHYFRGIPGRLQALGHSVHVARVSPVASIRTRAAQLAQQVEQLGGRVNIIAHSMGGLDARVAIARHGLGDRVASLTTIGTPHHGTPLADIAFALGDFRLLRQVLDSVGVNVDGLYDVSTQRMLEFNRVILDSPNVVYTSVVGAVNLDTVGVNAMLSAGHTYLLRKAGPNDGVVPATSQRWGEALDQVEADHWAQIGWFGRFDVLSFYAQLAERLAERGL